ncbi:MAG: type II secretion system secretin GspD [Desulfobacula sp.]|jgi:general secretion pathway protein D|uniref:type II secretion system secretin GspD n=1 Tax=Desulfobacula sp. TaxID=2593537 RepID=UPI001DF0B25B|nr:type II secretion system secretin GspD [Desulfobacula sp.]MBT3485992.1 type II secretion system secretin GspD [Desulfobacula sp.]MBT3804050.1 type II secretion system secretin GspD [Desulfobacula sp.]MBT4026393.1 type II secretion system secretin GspD [Desulfobacula sp.]MBT4200459.1 type II secretion system secretin GspD [Desulfobacula sp.]
MNNGVSKIRHSYLLQVSLMVLCAAILSGCMPEIGKKKATLDEQIYKNDKQIYKNKVQDTKKEELSARVVKAEALKKSEQKTENVAEPADSNVIKQDSSWEHISDPQILGLQTSVKRYKRTPMASTPPMHIDLAFDNADLTEILDLILYDHFNINYMIDPSINAKLTFHFEGDFSNTTIIDKLNSVLHVSGIAIVEGVGSIFKVVLKNDSARSGEFKLNDSRTLQETGDVTRQIKIKYLNAIDTSKTLKFFISKNALIIPDSVNNSIIITDTSENILKAASIIDALDVPFFRDISWKVFPVFKAKAETIAIDLTKMFKTNGLFTRPGIVNGSYHILPIKTINGILVATKWPEIIDTIGDWIKIMDQADETSTDVFVYYVENGNAVDLADILKEVYGGKATTTKNSGSQKIVQATTGQPTNPVAGKTIAKKTVSGDLIDDVKIIADATNNAIIFKAHPNDFANIKKILKKLDIMPRQVLLNVLVAEVTLKDSFEFGVQWMLSDKMNGYNNVVMNDQKDSFVTTGTALGAATGFTYGVFNAADALKALVKAVGEDSNINILSSPNIIGVDNKEAYIEVAEEVPTVTGTVTDANGGVTNTVQYKKTGIILKATPSINSRGLVKLDLTQEVSEPGTFDTQLNNYSILTRKATTSLVVEDKQTIFIGGLMRETTSISDAGVPFLKDIPVLGYFFKKESQESQKTELIFLITPHVIRSRTEADSITKEFTQKISQVKELIDN